MKVLIQLPNTQVKEYLAKLINEGAYTIAKYTSQRISGKIALMKVRYWNMPNTQVKEYLASLINEGASIQLPNTQVQMNIWQN